MITTDSETAQTAHDLINILKDLITDLPDYPEKAALVAAETALHAFAHVEFVAAGGTYQLPDEASRSSSTGGPVILSTNTGNKGAGDGPK